MTGVTNGACADCSSNVHCTNGALPVCTSSGTCVQCVANSDCSGATPICGAGNACRACGNDGECSARNGAGLLMLDKCDTGVALLTGVSDGACADCSSNGDCSNPSYPVCASNGVCVGGCLVNSDCSGAAPICSANTCRGCASNAECQAIHGSGLLVLDKCDNGVPLLSGVANGACADCAADADCTNPALPACNSNGVCVECLNDGYCSGATPICSASVCVGCSGDLQCSTRNGPAQGRCDLSGNPVTSGSTDGSCVFCNSHSQCSGATPVCLPDGSACRSCASDAECFGIYGAANGKCDTGIAYLTGAIDGRYCFFFFFFFF